MSSSSAASMPLANAPPTSPPMLVPAATSIGIRCSSNHRITPTCAIPRALPPPKATPTVGRLSCATTDADTARTHTTNVRIRLRILFKPVRIAEVTTVELRFMDGSRWNVYSSKATVNSRMRHVMTAALVMLLAGIAVLALAWTFQRSLIYFPFGQVPSPADVGLDAVEEVAFETDDGIRLHGWFVSSRVSPPSFTIVVFNGNAGNRAYRASLARAFASMGWPSCCSTTAGSAVTPDARPNRALPLMRARRAHTWRRGADVDPARVAYFGESLGAAVAVGLAAESPPAALVLRSPFTSLTAVGRVHYPLLPVQWLLRDRWASLDRIAGVTSPLLVIAGDRDSIVPPEQSRQLYDAATGPKTLVIVRGADHNDADLVAGPEVIKATLRLLQQR